MERLKIEFPENNNKCYALKTVLIKASLALASNATNAETVF